MYDEKKLHPLTLITDAYNRLVSFVIPIIFFAFSSYRLEGLGLILTLLFFTIFGLVYLVDVLKFIRTSYWIDHNRFVVKSGLFIQKEKDVQISRIQSIDYSENLIHRLFNVTKIEIKTPGKGIALDALSKENALKLATQLHYLKETQRETVSQSAEEAGEKQIDRQTGFSLQKVGVTKSLYSMSLIDIIKMNLMGGSILKGLVVLVGALNIFEELISDTLFDQAETIVSQTTILAQLFIIVLAIVIFYVIGNVISVIKNFDYKVELTKEHLTIEKGLLELKSQTIALANIQSVWEEQNWVQKLFGYTTLSVGITSDEESTTKDDTSESYEKGKIVLLPLVKKEQLASLRGEIVPHFNCLPAQQVVPIRSLRRFIQWPLLCWISLTLLISYFLWSFAWTIGIVGSLVILFYGYRSYKKTGYALSKEEVTFELPKLISTETVYLRKDRVLNLTVKQNPFLKRSHLGKVEVFSALGDSAQNKKLSFIEEADCERLFDWFLVNERSAEPWDQKV
ncbi:PH domain-containing protein [Carnobacterium pleistocenium]|uniref:PH domain-containing protein n=1 Tax=Carnobacterium pleistocenium TaxID=181073 RepID=UPI0005535992|nr:PH domain-containing protein [Carnobacterium pleistocenium]